MDYNEWKFNKLVNEGKLNKTQSKFSQLKPVEKVLAFILAVVFVSAIFFSETWVWMIMFGVLHSIFNSVPAIGFWSTSVLTLIISFVIRSLRTAFK